MSTETSQSLEQPKDLQRAYALLSATTPRELNWRYGEEDQKLMRSREWDYENPDLVVNKIKVILESVDPSSLSEDEREWRENILWFWYHHAISCAIWRYQDKVAAQTYADTALAHHAEDHPNQITKLLQLLVYDRLDEAKTWAATITDAVERDTAAAIIAEYEGRGFF